MTLQQLKYIVTVDEYRHFGKAAEACGVTQSTLSLMIKKLEEELDARIFDRESYPVETTQLGRKIIDQAKVTLYNSAQIAEITQSEKTSLSGQVRIALISTVAPILVPSLFRYMMREHPALSLITEEMLTDNLLDKLRKAEIDMGIIAIPIQDPNLLVIPLYSERFFAYVSEKDPAYALESISVKGMRNRPIWVIRNGVRLYHGDEKETAGDRPFYEHYFEGGRVGTLLQLVNDNGGITVVPETHIQLILYSWQKNLRPIVDPIPRRTISLVIRKDFIHEAQLNAVVQAIKTAIPGTFLESPARQNYIKL